MYLEGSDQQEVGFTIFTRVLWDTRQSLWTLFYLMDCCRRQRFKDVKIVGNVISPEEILKNYGADILRSWVASSDYSEDLRIDKNILVQHAESYRKRNTFRFILGNIKDNFDQKDFNFETKRLWWIRTIYFKQNI